MIKSRPFAKWAPGLVLLAAPFLLSGCAGYRLGSMLPAGIDTVYVPTFINKTTEPLVDVECTRAVIEQIQLDGSLRIAEEAGADAILEVTVYGFDLTPLAFDQGRQRTLAEEFRLVLTASIVLRERATDKILVEDPVIRGDTTFELLGDLTSAKRNALPLAADDLGRDIVQRLVEYW